MDSWAQTLGRANPDPYNGAVCHPIGSDCDALISNATRCLVAVLATNAVVAIAMA